MKNRTVLGIICIALALVLCFGVGPLINNLTDGTVEVVRIKDGVTVASGSEITMDHIEAVKAKKSLVSNGVYYTYDVFMNKYFKSSSEDYVGVPYADCEMVAGEYISQHKVSINGASSGAIFDGLYGSNLAMSISLDSFADGLSGKLENGDIVSVIVFSNENGERSSFIPEGLEYVKVITTTTDSGIDRGDIAKNEDGSMAESVSTATLLLDVDQAQTLHKYANTGSITLALRCKGTSPSAESLLERNYGEPEAEKPAPEATPAPEAAPETSAAAAQ